MNAVRGDATRRDAKRRDATRKNVSTSPRARRVVESLSAGFERRLRLLHDASQLANGVRRALIVAKRVLVVARGRLRANFGVENSLNRLERRRARVALDGSTGFHVARDQVAEFFARRELCSKVSLGYLWIDARVLAFGTCRYVVDVLIVLCQDFRVFADVEVRQRVETFVGDCGAVVGDCRFSFRIEQPEVCNKARKKESVT